MEAFIQPFSMYDPPLMRARLLRTGAKEHILLLDMHHAITDGTSVGIMLNEVFQLYDGAQLPAVPLQYKDYAVWKTDRLKRGVYKESAQYWKQMLEGYKPFKIPVDYENSDPLDHGGDIVAVHVPMHWFEKLKHHLPANVTDFTLLYSMYLLLMHQRSGATDLVVGSYSFGRQHPDVQHTIGLFINTLPLRSQIRVEETFVDFVVRMQQLFVDAFRHAEYPFEYMLKDSQIPIEPDQNPLFDTMFTMNNFQVRTVEAAGLSMSAHPYAWDFSEYDIYVAAQQVEDGFEVHFNYRTALFKKETMKQMAAQYINGFQVLDERPELKIGAIPQF